jgi:hypothetical protein
MDKGVPRAAAGRARRGVARRGEAGERGVVWCGVVVVSQPSDPSPSAADSWRDSARAGRLMT